MVIDVPVSPELIILSSDDEGEELEPEEEAELGVDGEDQVLIEQMGQELSEEDPEEEPQEEGHEQDTEGSAASEDSDASDPDYDPS